MQALCCRQGLRLKPAFLGGVRGLTHSEAVKLLGLPASQTSSHDPKLVRAAFRRQALRLHPDVARHLSGEEATNAFLQLTAAYEVLMKASAAAGIAGSSSSGSATAAGFSTSGRGGDFWREHSEWWQQQASSSSSFRYEWRGGSMYGSDPWGRRKANGGGAQGGAAGAGHGRSSTEGSGSAGSAGGAGGGIVYDESGDDPSRLFGGYNGIARRAAAAGNSPNNVWTVLKSAREGPSFRGPPNAFPYAFELECRNDSICSKHIVEMVMGTKLLGWVSGCSRGMLGTGREGQEAVAGQLEAGVVSPPAAGLLGTIATAEGAGLAGSTAATESFAVSDASTASAEQDTPGYMPGSVLKGRMKRPSSLSQAAAGARSAATASEEAVEGIERLEFHYLGRLLASAVFHQWPQERSSKPGSSSSSWWKNVAGQGEERGRAGGAGGEEEANPWQQGFVTFNRHMEDGSRGPPLAHLLPPETFGNALGKWPLVYCDLLPAEDGEGKEGHARKKEGKGEKEQEQREGFRQNTSYEEEEEEAEWLINQLIFSSGEEEVEATQGSTNRPAASLPSEAVTAPTAPVGSPASSRTHSDRRHLSRKERLAAAGFPEFAPADFLAEPAHGRAHGSAAASPSPHHQYGSSIGEESQQLHLGRRHHSTGHHTHTAASSSSASAASKQAASSPTPAQSASGDTDSSSSSSSSSSAHVKRGQRKEPRWNQSYDWKLFGEGSEVPTFSMHWSRFITVRPMQRQMQRQMQREEMSTVKSETSRSGPSSSSSSCFLFPSDEGTAWPFIPWAGDTSTHSSSSSPDGSSSDSDSESAQAERLLRSVTHSLLHYRTPGVSHYRWLRHKDSALECRASRVKLPPPSLWLWEPRSPSHCTGGNFSFELARRRERDAAMHPAVYALSAAVLALEAEWQAGRKQQRQGELVKKMVGGTAAEWVWQRLEGRGEEAAGAAAAAGEAAPHSGSESGSTTPAREQEQSQQQKKEEQDDAMKTSSGGSFSLAVSVRSILGLLSNTDSSRGKTNKR